MLYTLYMDGTPSTFGKRLKLALQEAKLSQADLSRHLGVSEQRASQLVRYEDAPGMDFRTFFHLAEWLNVDLIWLALGQGQKERKTMGKLTIEFLRKFENLQPNQQDAVITTINTFLLSNEPQQDFTEGKRR